MADKLLFILLAEEFGGTKFGPFEGIEIRFGSDPQNSEITLPEALGVLPEHVKVIKQRDGSFILAPVERSAGVFIWRAGGKPRQINSPIAMQAGDGFSLVTAEGPRFYVSLEDKPLADKSGPKQGLGAAANRLSGQGLLAEIQRVGLAKAVATNTGAVAMKAWTFIKSGSFLQPRYIIVGLMMVTGYVMAMGTGCAALKLYSDLGTAKENYEEVNVDLQSCEAGTDEDTLETATEGVLGGGEWVTTLQRDPELSAAYQKKLTSAFSNRNEYKWVIKESNSDVTRLRSQLRDKMEPGIADVLAFAAAVKAGNQRDWNVILEDAGGNRACRRGPLQLTYRQAHRLELDELQLDAAVLPEVANSVDKEEKQEALEQTAANARVQAEFDNDTVDYEGASLQGGYQCLFVEGEDHRDDIRELANALADQVGDNAAGVPRPGRDFWIAARLVKFGASDFEYGYDDIELVSQAPSTVLDSMEATDAQKRFAIDTAAEIMARAVVIRCTARLDQTPAEHLGEPAPRSDCLLLNYLAGAGC